MIDYDAILATFAGRSTHEILSTLVGQEVVVDSRKKGRVLFFVEDELVQDVPDALFMMLFSPLFPDINDAWYMLEKLLRKGLGEDVKGPSLSFSAGAMAEFMCRTSEVPRNVFAGSTKDQFAAKIGRCFGMLTERIEEGVCVQPLVGPMGSVFVESQNHVDVKLVQATMYRVRLEGESTAMAVAETLFERALEALEKHTSSNPEGATTYFLPYRVQQSEEPSLVWYVRFAII